MMKCLYALTIIFGLVTTSYAIYCHVCSSTEHIDCLDPFNRTGGIYVTNCNKLDNPFNALSTSYSARIPATMKRPAKGCLKLELEAGGVLLTNRVCYWGDTANAKEGCKLTNELLFGPLKQKSCDVCTEDLCNSCTTIGIFATTVICLVVLLRMIW